MSASVVRIQNAHKFYNKGRQNELHVMNDISLELPAAGLVAIFGKSGCGKTTLLNAIGGLDKIASGSIALFGRDLRADTDMLRNRYIGYIFQNYNLNVNETVYENVAAALRLCGMDDEQEIAERVTAALKNVGMDKYVSRTPDTLSGGQQQRVAIARALVKNPAIILADEPTGNLDEANTVLVMDILKEISKTHLVLLVTHEAHLVDFYCDRVIEIVDGTVTSDRQNEGANGYVRRNKNDIYLGELEKSETAASGVTLTCYGDPPADGKTIGLTLVNMGGKLYLKCDDPSVKLLDEGSEIRLREGVFDEKPAEDATKNRNGHAIDMSRLTPVEGTHYGRLYHPKNAFLSAWRQYFAKPKKKRGRGLRVVLILLAVVLAFMAATIGAGFKEYAKLAADHNDRLYYVPLDPSVDYSGLDVSAGHNGVTHARIVGSDPLYQMDRLSFNTAAFMTAVQVEIMGKGYAQNAAYMPDLPVRAGTATVVSAEEIVITTAIADELIESSTVGYIDSYPDLVGMVTSQSSMYISGLSRGMRIVGVVESPEAFYYVSGPTLSRLVLEQYIGTDACALSELHLTKTVPEGKVLFLHWISEDDNSEQPSPYAVGDSVTVMGKNLTVGEVLILDFSQMEELGLDRPIGFVLNDADFESLAYSLDRPPEGFGTFYDLWDWGNGERMYSNHLQIRSSDPAVTEAHLSAVLGEDGYITPATMLDRVLAEARTEAMLKAAGMLFFLALMCLCVFFIMRASFMSRVREVGILRAIGVTRKNLVFRFAVETGLLLLLTTVIGYVCTALFVSSLADAPLFSSMFFFPPWLSVGLLILISAVGIFFGVLPALLLLRRTPSEILAKYDI